MNQDALAMRQRVWQLAWPVVIQYSLMTLMLYVDTIMLGHFSKTSLAAMGVAHRWVMTIRIILMALSIGTIAMVARAYGENDLEKTRINAATALWLGLIIGVVVSLVGVLLAPRLIRVYVEEPQLVYEATVYIRLVLGVFCFSYLFLVGSSILRGGGDTKTPMLIALCANIFNIIGNYLLIYGRLGLPELGILGAGLATALGRFIEGVLILLSIFSVRSVIPLTFRSLLLVNWNSFKSLFKISLPAAVEPVVMQVGLLLIYRIITGLGETAIASHQILFSIESIAFMPAIGFAVACTTLVGQNLGARRPDLAEASSREAVKIALIIMSAFAIIFVSFPSFLVRIFTQTPEVIKLGAICLVVSAIEEPFIGWVMIHRATLRGAGDTRSPLLVAFIGTWLVRLPLSYLFAIVLNWGLVGIWVTMPIDWFVRSILYRILYLKGRWKRISL